MMSILCPIVIAFGTPVAIQAKQEKIVHPKKSTLFTIKSFCECFDNIGSSAIHSRRGKTLLLSIEI